MSHAIINARALHTIYPANERCVSSIPSPFLLGPLDHLISPQIPVGTIWIYESSVACPTPVSLQRFKQAIAALLDYYPQLTGRLTIDQQTGIRSVTRLSTGASLVEAFCDASLSTFRNVATNALSITDFPGAGATLLPPWNATEEGCIDNPLLSFQHTRFVCGSVAIGIRLARIMGGAGGFLQLFSNLAEIYTATGQEEGLNLILKNPPHIMPFLAKRFHNSVQPELPGVHADSSGKFGYFVHKAHSRAAESSTELMGTPPPVTGREIRFSSSALATLKSQATPPNGDSWVSTFSALSAALWQWTQKARLSLNGCGARKSTFFTSIDFSREAGLPNHFFPSSVVTPFMEQFAGDLCKAPLWHVASSIQDMTRSVNLDDVQELCDWIVEQSCKSGIKQKVSTETDILITTAWNKFSMYDDAVLDVEPTYVGVPFTPTNLVDGLGFFLQPKERNGDIIVALALNNDVWEVLDCDPGFQAYFY